MFEDDQDTLAAEYVLGTLSAQEREQAEALLAFDPAFEAAVRQWERRLGELNVMVEAVEPPPRVWEKIRTEIGLVETAGAIELPRAGEPGQEPAPPVTPPAADLLPSEAEAAKQAQPSGPAVPSPSRAPAPPKVESSAEVIALEGRLTRWRGTALGISALAAMLALFIAVSQVAPEVIPPQLLPKGAKMAARPEAPARSQQDRLVAVLQQGPTAPAFLLTIDTKQRTLVVRRVSAVPETAKSYELWLISSRFPAPRSLGLLGSDEFTARALPKDYDVDTLQTARYAVSLEPAGGSPSGVPTGPVLFSGSAVESLPATAPPPATPKT